MKRTAVRVLAASLMILTFSGSVCLAEPGTTVANPAYDPTFRFIGINSGVKTQDGRRIKIGDATNNGVIDINDGYCIQDYVLRHDVWGLNARYMAKQRPEMDVNGDGKVTAVDATIVMRYYYAKRNYDVFINGDRWYE